MKLTDDQKTGDLVERKVGQTPAPPSEGAIVLDDSKIQQTADLTESQIQELTMQISSADLQPPVEDDIYDSEQHQGLLAKKREEVQVWQQELSKLSFKRRAILAPAVPVLVLALVGLALVPTVFLGAEFWAVKGWHIFPVPASPSLSLCLLLLIAVLPAYYFGFTAPISNVKRALWHAKEELERLEVSTVRGRQVFLSERLRSLTKKAAQGMRWLLGVHAAKPFFHVHLSNSLTRKLPRRSGLVNYTLTDLSYEVR